MSGIAVEDLLVHLTQGRPGVGAQLLDESIPHHAKRLERVSLSSATELGQHQLPGQAFVERMVGNHCGELRQQLSVSTGSQARIVAVEDHREPLGLQCDANVIHPRSVERRERNSSPQRQCLLEKTIRFDRIRRRARLAASSRNECRSIDKRISGQHIAAGLPRDFHAVFRDHLPKPG